MREPPFTVPAAGSPPAGVRRRGRDVLRAVRAAPAVLIRAYRDAGVCCRAFDRAVLPVLDARLGPGPERDRLAGALRAWSAKGGHMIASLCRAAGVAFTPQVAEAAALGCAFARLYDDLLDEHRRPGFAERAGLLFTGRPWAPHDALEDIAGRVFRVLERRLDRPPGDPLYAALADVHRYQCRSARQSAPDVTLAELADITWGKGAATLTVLYALARPAMGAAELGAVGDLGAVLQLCDDHHDRAADAAQGIATLPGAGVCGGADLRHRLAAVEERLARVHGRRRARTLVDEVHVFLLLSALGRTAGRLRRSSGRTPSVSARPVLALLLRGPSAVGSGEWSA